MPYITYSLSLRLALPYCVCILDAETDPADVVVVDVVVAVLNVLEAVNLGVVSGCGRLTT